MIFVMRATVEPQEPDIDVPINTIDAIMAKPSIGWSTTFQVLDSENVRLHTYQMTGMRLSASIQQDPLQLNDLEYLEVLRDEIIAFLERVGR